MKYIAVYLLLLTSCKTLDSVLSRSCPVETCGENWNQLSLEEVTDITSKYTLNNFQKGKALTDLLIDSNVSLSSYNRNPFDIQTKKTQCETEKINLVLSQVKQEEESSSILNDHRIIKDEHLASAIILGCDDITQKLIQKIPSKQFHKVMRSFKFAHQYTDSYQLRVAKALKPILIDLKNQCEAKNSESCASKEKIKLAVMEYEKRYQAYKYSLTDEAVEQGYANEICSELNNINKRKAWTKEEREKGKISGYVNVLRLKQWGDYIYDHQKKLKKLENNYKSKYKESFKFTRCK